MTPSRSRRRRILGNLAWGLVALVLIAAVAMLAKTLVGDKSTKKRVVHNITLLRPPPPPPPPKLEEKPPEIKKEEVKIEQPKPQPQPAPPGDDKPAGKQLGLDAEGGAGNDGFGLAARKGGVDITKLGSGPMNNLYASLIERQMQDALARNKKLQGHGFRVVVKVWFGLDGRLQRAELAGTSGDSETDELVRVALGELPTLKEAPSLKEPLPSDLPQPVKLRVTNRF